jgi:hypothetical protein
MTKKILCSAFLATLFVMSFGFGANASLNVYAAPHEAGNARPTPTPTPIPTTGPLTSDPFPCLPKCPGQ